MLFILYLTLNSGGAESTWTEFLHYPGVDKLGHFGLFFIWSLLFFPELVMPGAAAGEKAVKFWIVATNSLVLGLLIEIVQSYLPQRNAEPLDLLADVIGSVTALAAVKIVRLRKSNLN